MIFAVRKPFYDHAITVTIKADPLDTVPLVPAEQEQGPFFKRVQAVLKPDDGYQAGDAPAEVRPAAFDDDTPAPGSIPKHYGSLS